MYLRQFKVTLTALSPVHIGSGEVINNGGSIFDQRTGKLYYLNLQKLVSALKKANKLGEYEKFILSGNPNQRQFLESNNIEWKALCNSPIIVNMEIGTRFNKMHTFAKDVYGNPYIPGSSLKGAFRTIMLCCGLRGTGLKSMLPRPRLNRLKKPPQAKEIETKFLAERMRAYRFSDSKPIPKDSLTVCQKIDQSVAGLTKGLPTFRECLKPDTKVELKLTVDTRLLGEETTNFADNFTEMLGDYNKIYWDTFREHFPYVKQPEESASIYLGGGTGFITKTMLIGLLKDDHERVKYISDYLHSAFPFKHRHDRDVTHGVSPHTIKLAKFNGEMFEMGKCRVELAEV